MDDFPELDEVSGSWFATGICDGDVTEWFDRKNAKLLHDSDLFTVEIASVYLARINREIKEEQS